MTGETPDLDDSALATQKTVYAPGSFLGRTVLVSGGAGGIGRACAWLLGRLGARVILAGRDPRKLETAVAAMKARGIVANSHDVDIREPESVAALFDWLDGEKLSLDLLVNSAGGQFPQAAIDFSE